LFIGEGEWKDFINLDVYKGKKYAYKVSYFCEELIQITCENALVRTVGGNANIFNVPSAIHEMAKEPCFIRRDLSKCMIESINNFPESANEKL